MRFTLVAIFALAALGLAMPNRTPKGTQKGTYCRCHDAARTVCDELTNFPVVAWENGIKHALPYSFEGPCNNNQCYGNNEPIVVCTAPNSVAVGEVVTIDCSGTTDPDGDDLSITISDGDYVSSEAGTVFTHTYTTEGNFEVVITVSDGCAEPTATFQIAADFIDATCFDGLDNEVGGVVGSADCADPVCEGKSQKKPYTGPVDTEDVGTCRAEIVKCLANGERETIGEVIPVPQDCSGFDIDCDNSTDDVETQFLTTWYADSDADGYGNDDINTQSCNKPSGYVDVAGDCNDANSAINPGVATDPCDGVDNDCDDLLDENPGCPSGDVCEAGTCVTPPSPDVFTSCNATADCAAGEVCFYQTCVPDYVDGANGIVDAGERCDDGNEIVNDGCTYNTLDTGDCAGTIYNELYYNCDGGVIKSVIFNDCCGPDCVTCAVGRFCVYGSYDICTPEDSCFVCDGLFGELPVKASTL